MTQQITFQQALKLLNQKEENLLEQTSQVRERKAQLIGTLRFLRIPESLDVPENPGKEDKINPARTSPEIINYFGPTESGRQSSKPSSDFSSKTSPLQVDSIYERAHQKAYQEAIEEMRKGAPVPQTLFPDNPHEILTGSTTLQELLDNLDNLDGIRFNQDIIREFLTDLINSDSVEKTNDHWNSLGSFPGYQSTTEEIGPGTADQDSNIREPEIPYPYSNIKDRPSPDSNISDLAIPDNPITDPAIPDNDISHLAILYRDSKDPFIPYSNIKDRPSPDSDPAVPDSNIWDPAVGDSDPAVGDSDIRNPNVPDSLMELRPNFKKTPNLGEKMKRVGIAAQGKTLSPNEVAKLLIDQGQYRSRMKNIRYQVRWVMRNNPLQYEKIGEDTFRFIGPVRKTSRNLPASPLRMPPRRIQKNH